MSFQDHYIHIRSTMKGQQVSKTWSDSSILNVILPKLSPTPLNNRITPALDSADVLVARGSSPSTSRKSTKLGSVCRTGCLAMQLTNLQQLQKVSIQTIGKVVHTEVLVLSK
jgi:hypothetical protein